jgi:hypothetical protein
MRPRDVTPGPKASRNSLTGKKASTLTITSGDAPVSLELRAIEREFPGWHLFPSDAGRIWAVTTHTHAGGSGTTLDAETPALARQQIAEQEHLWHCTCGTAA